MIGLTNLELYNSFFNITEENYKFEIYTQPLDSGFSFRELKDKVAEALGLSDKSIEDLEHEIQRQILIKLMENMSIKKSYTDGYHVLVIRYSRSPF